MEAAKYEAIASIDGQPSRHKSYSQRSGERRLSQAVSGIQGKIALASEIKQVLAADPKVTELRKLDKKVATARRQLTSEVNRAYSAGDNEDTAMKGEHLEQELAALAGVIAERIEERKVRPKR